MNLGNKDNLLRIPPGGLNLPRFNLPGFFMGRVAWQPDVRFDSVAVRVRGWLSDTIRVLLDRHCKPIACPSFFMRILCSHSGLHLIVKGLSERCKRVDLSPTFFMGRRLCRKSAFAEYLRRTPEEISDMVRGYRPTSRSGESSRVRMSARPTLFSSGYEQKRFPVVWFRLCARLKKSFKDPAKTIETGELPRKARTLSIIGDNSENRPTELCFHPKIQAIFSQLRTWSKMTGLAGVQALNYT